MDGFIKKNNNTLFDGRFTEDDLPKKLKKSKVCGKDTRKNRFILVYSTNEEKEKIMNLLNIDGKKVIYSVEELS